MAAIALSSCTGSVTFRSPVDYRVVLDAYTSQFAAQGFAGTNPVPCTQPGGDAMCQSYVTPGLPGEDIVLKCDAQNRCDPEPYPFTMDLGVQDLTVLAEPQISVVDRLQLVRVDLSFRTNTANIGLPPFELRWGSESASVGNLASTTQRLALVPIVDRGYTGAVPVVLDEAGLAALDTFVQSTSTRVRFFLVTVIDVEPATPLPAGAVDLQLGLIIRASGKIR